MKQTTESGRDRLPRGMVSLKMFKINHSKALVIAYLNLRSGLNKYTFNQTDIINQTDIGRTVVRQCLKELVAEGVLNRKGVSFYKLNHEKLEELYYTQDRSENDPSRSDSDTDRSENDLSRSESDPNRSENGAIHSSVLDSSNLDSKSIDSSDLDTSETKESEPPAETDYLENLEEEGKSENHPVSFETTSSISSKNCGGAAAQEKSQKHSGTTSEVETAKPTPRISGVALEVPESFMRRIDAARSKKLASDEAKKKAGVIQARLNNGNNVTEEEFSFLIAYRPDCQKL